MRNLFKKVTAVAMAMTMVIGATGIITPAAVATGTNVATSNVWTSYSIYTKDTCLGAKEKWAGGEEDNCWYHSLTEMDDLLSDQHYEGDPVTDAEIKAINDYIKKEGKKNPTVSKHAETWGEQNCYRTFGENASITTKTANSFTMNVVSTGSSANWAPIGGKDENGDFIYLVNESNPWGVDATTIVNVERGRVYNISFKIKSTLANELVEAKEREDGTGYNIGTGKFNYVKHIHFKAYDDKDDSGAALEIQNVKATIGGQNVAVVGDKKLNEKFDSFVKLDSKNTADDGWVTVSCAVQIPADKADYQADQKQATLGFKIALGAFLYEFPDEAGMSGTIELKDFAVTAAQTALKAGKIKKVTPAKKAITVKLGNVKGAQKYEIQYATVKTMDKALTKTTKKKQVKIKKLSSKTKYFVRVRGFKKVNGVKVYGKWSKKAKVKTK